MVYVVIGTGTGREECAMRWSFQALPYPTVYTHRDACNLGKATSAITKKLVRIISSVSGFQVSAPEFLTPTARPEFPRLDRGGKRRRGFFCGILLC